MEKETALHIEWKTLWRVFFFVLIVLVLYLVRSAISVLLVSIFISLGLDPIISFLEERKVPRLLGTLMIFFLCLFFLSVVIYFILPVISVEIINFIKDFNKIISLFLGFDFAFLIKGETFVFSLDKLLNILKTNKTAVSGAAFNIFHTLVLVIATILSSFYLMLQKNGIERFLRAVLPDNYENVVLRIFIRFKIKMRRWFGAQLILSLIVGLLTSVGVWLLGVRYAAVIGILAAVFEIVPVIGPVLVGMIAFFIAISESLITALYTVLFFIFVQQFESHILTPVLISKTMRIHPIIVIFSLISGSQVAGLLGVILAVPIALLIQEIFEYISERKRERPSLI